MPISLRLGPARETERELASQAAKKRPACSLFDWSILLFAFLSLVQLIWAESRNRRSRLSCGGGGGGGSPFARLVLVFLTSGAELEAKLKRAGLEQRVLKVALGNQSIGAPCARLRRRELERARRKVAPIGHWRPRAAPTRRHKIDFAQSRTPLKCFVTLLSLAGAGRNCAPLSQLQFEFAERTRARHTSVRRPSP